MSCYLLLFVDLKLKEQGQGKECLPLQRDFLKNLMELYPALLLLCSVIYVKTKYFITKHLAILNSLMMMMTA